ncbi:hypothetical protein AB6A40_006752 [Gnathostoma spinigerum]|uniref:Uncharacterized protein n=1 Tax=Gnathostoma spinigerum TaxID=75299 RepID=A0ABD6EJG9_9BILA
MVEGSTDNPSCSMESAKRDDIDRVGAPIRPDRREFQMSLRQLNDLISSRSKEIHSILGEGKNHGELEKLKSRKKTLHAQWREEKHKFDSYKPKIQEIRECLDAKDQIISDIENGLIYKNEGKLLARLSELEAEYNGRSFTSRRDEQALVKEIDKLKRNRTLLGKYSTVNGERAVLVGNLQKLKGERDKIGNSLRMIKSELRSIDKDVEKNRRRVREAKEELDSLIPKRRKLISEYNKERIEFLEWKRSRNRRRLSTCDDGYPSTFPLAKSTSRFYPDEDEECDLEPFYEQKLSCTRLIRYIDSLSSQIAGGSHSCFSTSKDSSSTAEEASNDADESSDSADDLPPSFSALSLRKYRSLPFHYTGDVSNVQCAAPISRSRKKLFKKSVKKPSSLINHPVELVRLFTDLEVEAPSTYNQLAEVREKIVNQLRFFEGQTNLVQWDENDFNGMTVLSESERDSAIWNGSTDFSDAGSVAGSNLGCMSTDATDTMLSPVSPTAGLQPTPNSQNFIEQQLSSSNMIEDPSQIATSDEGIASKNSTF